MPLDKKDYPNIKYWHATSWTNVKTNKDIDVLTTDLKPKKKSSFWYFEDVNGSPLDEQRCNAITKRARDIFTHLNASGAGAAKWGDMGSVSQDYYRRGMYSHFPELRLCEFDWKVNRLATETYSSWYRKRKDKWGVTVKHVNTEGHNVTGDSGSAELSGPSQQPKRPQTPLQPVSCAKKVKSGGPPQPTPPAHTIVSCRPQPTPRWTPSVPALITPDIMPSSSVPEPSTPIPPMTMPSTPVSESSMPVPPPTMPSTLVSSTPVPQLPPMSTMPLTPVSSTPTPSMPLSSVAMSSTPIPPPILPLTPVSSVIPSHIVFPYCY